MKRSSLPQCLIGAVLAFAISIGTVGQLITGLELSASVSTFIPWCAAFSVICAVLLYFKYGWCALLALSAFGICWLYKNTRLADQISSLFYKLTSNYDKVYGTGVFGARKTQEAEVALLLIAFITAAVVCICICRRKRAWPAVCAALVPFILLLPVKLTQPDALYTYMGMAGIAVLLITDRVRRRDAKHFFRVFLNSAAVTAIMLAVLMVFNPQDEYFQRTGKLHAMIESLFDGLGSSVTEIASGVGTGVSAADSIDLRILGPKSDATHDVMKVKASFGGIVYLRGRDYDIYSGTSWISSEGRKEKALKGRGVRGTVTVSTKRKEGMIYVPYYPSDAVTLTDGYTKNEYKENEYSFTVMSSYVGYPYSDNTSYTALPHSTYAWAEPLVAEITEGKTRLNDKIEAINEYVKSCAEYDTKTFSMMNKGDDFAKWFIYDSETGYCAHFATAAAVLLRAAGIPARYVEGYYVQCEWEEYVTVSNQRAHAWVEYYDQSSSSWILLEATPAEALVWDAPAEDTPQTDTPPTEDTAPPDTAPVTNEPPVTDALQTTEPQIPDNVGNNGENNKTDKGKTTFEIPKWVKNLLCTALAFSLIHIQACIRIQEKCKRWNNSKPNAAALARYRQCALAARVTHTPMPDALEDIALKAKFSQHTVEGEELMRFEDFRKRIIKAISKMPWYKKLVMRWVFAIG